jgi:cytochrome c oxidase assembly factor 5
MVHRNTAADCLRPPLVDTLPTKCQQLKHGYGECKKGMVDMRKRFRGNKPIAVSTELEGDGATPSRAKEVAMLYAGRSTYPSESVRQTEGKEGSELDATMENAGYEKYIRNDGSVDWRKK